MANDRNNPVPSEPNPEQKSTPPEAGPIVPAQPDLVATPEKSDKDEPDEKPVKVKVQEDEKKPKKKDKKEEKKEDEKNFGPYQWIIDMVKDNKKLREKEAKQAQETFQAAQQVLEEVKKGGDPEQIKLAQKELDNRQFDVDKCNGAVKFVDILKHSLKNAATSLESKLEKGEEVLQSLKESIQQATADLEKSTGVNRAEKKDDLANQSFFGALKDLGEVCLKGMKQAYQNFKAEKPSKLETEVMEDFDEKKIQTRDRSGPEPEALELAEIKAPQPAETSQLEAQTPEPAPKELPPKVASQAEEIELPEFKAPTDVSKKHIIAGPSPTDREYPPDHVEKVVLAEGQKFDDFEKALKDFKEIPKEKEKSQTEHLSARQTEDGLVEIRGSKNSVNEFMNTAGPKLIAGRELQSRGPASPAPS